MVKQKTWNQKILAVSDSVKQWAEMRMQHEATYDALKKGDILTLVNGKNVIVVSNTVKGGVLAIPENANRKKARPFSISFEQVAWE